MADPSFDIVAEVDISELKNAIAQAMAEITNRFDFKGSKSNIQLEDNQLIILSDNDIKIKQVIDVLTTKMAKRGLSLKAFDWNAKPEPAAGGTCRMKVKIQKGLDKEQIKEINKLIKDLKLKVTVTNMGDSIRVSGKKKDDLQAIIQTIKKADLPFHVNFTNFK